MRRFIVLLCTCVLCVSCISAANAVTWLKLNGLSSGATLSPGGTVVFTCDCSVSGGEILPFGYFDVNNNGVYNPGVDIPVNMNLFFKDNSYLDENGAPNQIQYTIKPQINDFPNQPINLVIGAREILNNTTAYGTLTIINSGYSQGVQGHVYNADGTPAVGVVMNAYYPGQEETLGTFSAEATTNNNGAYSIQVPSSPWGGMTYQINLAQGGPLGSINRPYTLQGYSVTIINSSYVPGCDFYLPVAEPDDMNEATYTLQGVVSDGSGNRLPGIQVEIQSESQEWDTYVATDSSGSYTAQVPEDTYSLQLSSPAYVQNSYYYATVTGTDGATVQNMSMHRGLWSIRGNAINTSEASVPWLNISGSSSIGSYVSDSTTFSNSSGKFQIWTDNSYCTLNLQDYFSPFVDESVSGNVSGPMSLVVQVTPRSATVTGTVKDNNGNTLPGVEVLAQSNYYSASSVSNNNGSDISAFTNQFGQFTLNLEANTDYNLSMVKDGYGSLATWGGISFPSGNSSLNESLKFASHPAMLYASGIMPLEGTTSTNFNFGINYSSPDNLPPAGVWANIDGNYYGMTRVGTSTNYASGVTYMCSTTLGFGPHTTSFAATDMDGTPAQLNPSERLEHNAPLVQNAIVSGLVTLQGWQASIINKPVAIEIQDSTGNILETHTVNLSSSSQYSFSTGLVGSYTACAKASHWLAKAMPLSIDPTAGGSVSFFLLNGDVNGDNFVEDQDYSLMGVAWYSGAGDPNYNVNADLNGDGFVEDQDYSIMGLNWYQSGDPF